MANILWYDVPCRRCGCVIADQPYSGIRYNAKSIDVIEPDLVFANKNIATRKVSLEANSVNGKSLVKVNEFWTVNYSFFFLEFASVQIIRFFIQRRQEMKSWIISCEFCVEKIEWKLCECHRYDEEYVLQLEVGLCFTQRWSEVRGANQSRSRLPFSAAWNAGHTLQAYSTPEYCCHACFR